MFTVSAGGVKKKKTLQDKIREREERQREIMEKKAEAERIYTEAEKRQMQEESDLLIAQDALGYQILYTLLIAAQR